MLFLQRARQVAPSFALTPSNRAAIVRLCTLLRGMPLGIELAAAWMRTLTPEEIASEISRSLDFLTLADRGVPTRHRSLRAAFEHSWKLLPPAEQRAAAHLAIFRGGFGRDAALTVAGAALPALAALIDKSLVQVQADSAPHVLQSSGPQSTGSPSTESQSTGALRYDIHELLRQYLREKLSEMGDEPAVARRHLDYFMRMAEEVETHHYATVPHALFKRLRAEQGNLRAAMEWSLRDEHAPQEGLRLVGALGRYWYMGDAWQEGREWLGLALTHAVDAATPPAVRATILTQLGDMEHAMAEYAIAKRHITEALNIWRTLDNARQLAWALFQMGVLQSTVAEFAEAEKCFEECLAIYRTLDDRWFIALVLMQLASTKISDNDFERAIELLDEAVPIFRNQERTNIVAVALNMQGWGYVQRGDYWAAIENFQEALAIGQLEGNYQSMGWSYRNLGMAYRLVHELDEAERNIRAALHLYQQISFKSGMVIAFEILASVAAEQGKAETGVRWIAVAEALRQSIGLPRTPSDERLYYNAALQLTTAALDPTAWQAAFAAGSKLPLDEALALAQRC
jgi:tetratricopeptide (TPR) repeat protein